MTKEEPRHLHNEPKAAKTTKTELKLEEDAPPLGTTEGNGARHHWYPASPNGAAKPPANNEQIEAEQPLAKREHPVRATNCGQPRPGPSTPPAKKMRAASLPRGKLQPQ